MDDTQEKSMAYSHDFEEDMFLETGKKYILMMMTGEVLEGLITESHGAFNTFHINLGRTTRQPYYWDVDYGYPLELN